MIRICVFNTPGVFYSFLPDCHGKVMQFKPQTIHTLRHPDPWDRSKEWGGWSAQSPGCRQGGGGRCTNYLNCMVGKLDEQFYIHSCQFNKLIQSFPSEGYSCSFRFRHLKAPTKGPSAPLVLAVARPARQCRSWCLAAMAVANSAGMCKMPEGFPT